MRSEKRKGRLDADLRESRQVECKQVPLRCAVRNDKRERFDGGGGLAKNQAGRVRKNPDAPAPA